MPQRTQSLMLSDHEVEAEAFAWVICDRYGARNDDGPLYIRNHAGKDAPRELARAQEKALEALDQLDAITAAPAAA